MGFRHGEENSDSHIKTSLVAPGYSSFHEGKLMLGRWQGIFLCEFDGTSGEKSGDGCKVKLTPPSTTVSLGTTTALWFRWTGGFSHDSDHKLFRT